jgi:hypothetical protein
MARLIGFNEISIKKKVNQTLSQSRYQGLARNAANTRFVAAKQAMLEDFDEHPVTKEMVAGPYATENVGGVLPYGNLPAFLGNENSAADVEELRNILEKTKMSTSRPIFVQSDRGVSYSFKVSIPEVEDIYKKTPSDWSSMSWVEMVENGLNNFGSFIFSLLGYPSSVSGTGLQRGKSRSTKRRSPKIPYITEILEKFKNRFNFKE